MSEAESWLLHLVPTDGRLALDVGANEGAFTTLLADRFQEVHAFDPNPQITPTLRQAVGGRRNVRLLELAVYKEPGVLTLNLFQGSEQASCYQTHGPSDQRLLVPATSLDLLGYPEGGLPVDFIKIDTEGAEADVLRGAEWTILTHLPDLLVEIHSLDNLAFCQGILKSHGYDVSHIPHPHTGVHPGHCWLSASPTAAAAAERGIHDAEVPAH